MPDVKVTSINVTRNEDDASNSKGSSITKNKTEQVSKISTPDVNTTSSNNQIILGVETSESDKTSDLPDTATHAINLPDQKENLHSEDQTTQHDVCHIIKVHVER